MQLICQSWQQSENRHLWGWTLDYEQEQDKKFQIWAFANTYVLSRQKYKLLQKKKISDTHYQIIKMSLPSNQYLSSNSFFEAFLDCQRSKTHHWRGISLTYYCRATNLLPGSTVTGKVPLVLSTMLVLKKKSKFVAFITKKKKVFLPLVIFSCGMNATCNPESSQHVSSQRIDC